MANDTSKVKLPHKVVTSIINKAKDTSTIAALSPSTPQTFSDTTYIVFNPTTEAEVVAEGAKKSGSEVSTTPIVAKRVKVVTTTRVSDELRWADALIDYDINGFALSRKFAADLRKLRIPATGQRLYPEIPLSLNVGNIDGIPAATSGTVNGRRCKTDPKVAGIMGDFSTIKWGMVRDMTSEIIEYGDPDNTGQDLKGYNQIAYRTEAVLAYAVLDPKAFAVLKSA